jgi:hypothetical protein
MSEVLAAARIENGKLIAKTGNITAWQNNTLSFSNPGNKVFVPVVSDCDSAPFITNTHWIQDVGPDFIVVKLKAMDTGDRVYNATNFTAIIVSTP